MTFAEQNLEAFIDLLETQPGLFSQDNITNLKEFIRNIPDDIEKLSDAVATWYQKHSKILDAQLTILNKSSSKTERGPGSAKLNSNISEYQLDKKALLNAIQQSSVKGKGKDKKNSRG
ncbi:MAG: hypothetical protein SWZ49_00270 [Cyanobacteriota bacterium]|nr:hypothetical protein [Cyanobacteriota bacterium]